MLASKQQIIGIRTLLGKLNLKDDKEAIVKQYTNDRTNSISKMEFAEAKKLIANLKNPSEDSEERQRKHIIAMAHNMNWQLEGGKADMKRINDWVLSYGHLNTQGKKLNDYKGEDLQKLVTQFQKVYKHYLNSISKR